MSYSSKRTIVSIVAGVLLTITYIIYALGDAAPAPENLKGWAAAMLIFIGIGVAAIIVIMILFHIAFAIGIGIKQRSDKDIKRIMAVTVAEDERDKLVELKSNRIGQVFSGLGFVATLVALACGVSNVFALHILFGATAIGALAGGGVSIYYHERGV